MRSRSNSSTCVSMVQYNTQSCSYCLSNFVGQYRLLADWHSELHWLHIDALMQERCNSFAITLELHISFTNPSIFRGKYFARGNEMLLNYINKHLSCYMYSIMLKQKCHHFSKIINFCSSSFRSCHFAAHYENFIKMMTFPFHCTSTSSNIYEFLINGDVASAV